mmetsp:Transcript_18475/g.37493  ORF Transcript_18475/g.37493 Transcript_18475/m.37493 type:complete len:81 (+) Transcript_18475:1026-1268(+)
MMKLMAESVAWRWQLFFSKREGHFCLLAKSYRSFQSEHMSENLPPNGGDQMRSWTAARLQRARFHNPCITEEMIAGKEWS